MENTPGNRPPPGEALWPEPAPEVTGSDSAPLKALGGAAGPERGGQGFIRERGLTKEMESTKVSSPRASEGLEMIF